MVDDWITTKEAAVLSGYHENHLRRLIRAGEVRAKKFGIVWQISRSSLLNYLELANKSPDKRRGPK